MAIEPPNPLDSALTDDSSLTDIVFHQSERSLVSRRTLPDGGGTVVLKRPFGTDALVRLSHERRVLERLRNIPGVVQLANIPTPPHNLAFVDNGGHALKGLGRHLDRSQVVALGLAIADTLARVHDAGVFHLDINPANILVNPQTLEPTLIDFNIARSLHDDNDLVPRPHQLAGTLRYMAPEQTGRTGRGADERTDLYALGVVLYEQCVGHVPFQSDDLLELVRDQLVTPAPSPLLERPDLPPTLAAILLKLLEKDPQLRYQSALGLKIDLARLKASLENPATLTGDTGFALAQFDFPRRLTAPTSLVGRADDLARLEHALELAKAGTSNCLLVEGDPGVGKSVLAAALRSIAHANGGWFVYGSYDRLAPGAASVGNGLIRDVGRLLLGVPQERLEMDCQNIMQSLGPNLGFGATLLPEFVLLLGSHKPLRVNDPKEAETRLVQATLDLLGAIASPERPIVFVIDNLQWGSGATANQLMDALVTSQHPIPGLLLLAVNQTGGDVASPDLETLKARWDQLGCHPPVVRLQNLGQEDTATLLQTMLRTEPNVARALGTILHERTQGNPEETIELVNSLRFEGLLVFDPQAMAWTWDSTAVRKYVAQMNAERLLERRLSELPPDTQMILETLACLGGTSDINQLGMACGQPPEQVDQRLQAARHQGLVTWESADPATPVRLTQARGQQAIFAVMDTQDHVACHLKIARQLFGYEGLQAVVAEQYLLASGSALPDEECRQAVAVLRQAVALNGIGNYDYTARALTAAIQWLAPLQGEADRVLGLQLQIQLHATLYAQSRFDEADQVFEQLSAGGLGPVAMAPVIEMQMFSLTHRAKHHQSVALGLASLASLGLAMPSNPRPYIKERLPKLIAWCHSDDKNADFDRPEITDVRTLAAVRLILPMANAAFFTDAVVAGWIVVAAHQIWVEQGPSSALLAPLGSLPFVLCNQPQDYQGTYLASKHLVAVGEARGYGANTAMVRHYFSILGGHWAEPLENCISEQYHARSVFLQTGQTAFLADTYTVVDLLLDTSPTLDPVSLETVAALKLAQRSNYPVALNTFLPRNQLVLAFTGATDTLGSFSDAAFDAVAIEILKETGTSYNPAKAVYHYARTVVAALFDDTATLASQSQLAIESSLPAFYLSALIPFLRALALCEQARSSPVDARVALLKEVDEGYLPWLKQRAVEAPANFAHLALWIQAERAWAGEDFWGAGATFDRAVSDAQMRSRPWHCALITERAGLFHLAHGLLATGHALIRQARDRYQAWGAFGKVRHMQQRHTWLVGTPNTSRDAKEPHQTPGGAREVTDPFGNLKTTTTKGSDMVDLLGVLRASQALSSETSLVRLTERLVNILQSLTGATGAQLVVCRDSDQDWFLAGTQDATPLKLAGQRGLLPLSVILYVQRTGELLVVDDTALDGRFAQDSYFSQVPHCSMMCIPIRSQNELRGILWLESRAARAAFNAARLDALHLISGQLSVSLDNALLYASLEARVQDRTRELSRALDHLQKTQEDLVQAEKLASLGALVAGVAHELNTPIGNALVTASTMSDDANALAQQLSSGTLKKSLLDNFVQRNLEMSNLVQRSCERAATLISSFKQVSVDQTSEQRRMFDLRTLVDENLRAIKLTFRNAAWSIHNEVPGNIECDSFPGPLGQVITNLIHNADFHAFQGLARGTIRILARQQSEEVVLCVHDDGKGMSSETVARVFDPFFTTALGKGGSGLGLAISRNIVTGVLGGSLSALSEPGKGSEFIIRFPLVAPTHGKK